MDADAEADGPIECVANAARLGDRILDQPRRFAGAIGMVLHRVRPAEHGDAAVTRIVHHQAAGPPDRPVEMFVDAVQQFLRIVGIVAGDVAGGIDRVHGQHRHDATFRRFREDPHRTLLPLAGNRTAIHAEPVMAANGLGPRRSREIAARPSLGHAASRGNQLCALHHCYSSREAECRSGRVNFVQAWRRCPGKASCICVDS
jgi:hypothetical protein